MPNRPLSLSSPVQYRGRFAPTPSGPLHFGSLVAALGSYLDAKAHYGQWLVRIEDVDKSRAVEGADTTILTQLEQHGLYWDEEVIYQSRRDERYQAIIDELEADLYQCDCSRQQIRARADCYDGYCRPRQPRSSPYSVRFKNDVPVILFNDRWHGPVKPDSDCVNEDFIVRRRDGLFAYQLAVVIDDLDQGITDIVRGSDLLQPSFWQLSLWQRLAQRQPRLMHLPLVTAADGRKLSKQNHAAPVEADKALQNLQRAAVILGLGEITAETVDELIKKATLSWSKQWRMDAK